MYQKNHQIEPLHINQYDSTDGWSRGDTYRYGIWLPSDERPTGVAQADSWRNPGYVTECNLHLHANMLAGVYHGSKLQSTLARIGIRAYWGQKPGSIIESTLAHFPSVPALIQSVGELNEQLPEEHQLPEFVEYEGDRYPARVFLESLAEGKVMVAGSRGGTKEADTTNALVAAHDMIFHVPYWLATTPEIREKLQFRARTALANTPPDAVETNTIFPTLEVGKVMYDIDHGISGSGMQSLVRRDYGVADDNFYRVLQTNTYQGAWAASEVREHVAYLGEHVEPVDLSATA